MACNCQVCDGSPGHYHSGETVGHCWLSVSSASYCEGTGLQVFQIVFIYPKFLVEQTTWLIDWCKIVDLILKSLLWTILGLLFFVAVKVAFKFWEFLLFWQCFFCPSWHEQLWKLSTLLQFWWYLHINFVPKYVYLFQDLQVHESCREQFKTLADLFPEDCPVFMLGNPYYGCMGEVDDCLRNVLPHLLHDLHPCP